MIAAGETTVRDQVRAVHARLSRYGREYRRRHPREDPEVPASKEISAGLSLKA